MKISPAKQINAHLTLPGDKSISHRAAIIAALGSGRSELENFSNSKDCHTTLTCLQALGASVQRTSDRVLIDGIGLGGFRQPSAPLDCGNSGSTMRMLAGVLAAQDFATTLIGDESLSARPMRRIIEPLEVMGANIRSNNFKPPLEIAGNRTLRAINFESPVASAQVKSAVLFAGLHAAGDTRVTERRPTRDHTERLLKFFGVPLSSEKTSTGSTRITVTGPAQPAARNLKIPGDISSAAFFIAAAALLANSHLQINNVGLNPTRTQFISVFTLLGLNVTYETLDEGPAEPSGSVSVSSERRREQPSFQSANRLPADFVPSVIDELPLLAVVGSQLPGGITVRGATELRYKESDRITATVSNLRAMGADAEEFEDGFVVRGLQKLRGASLSSYGDHRIAMAFTIAALLAEGDSELDDPECVAVSFPDFFEVVESIVER